MFDSQTCPSTSAWMGKSSWRPSVSTVAPLQEIPLTRAPPPGSTVISVRTSRPVAVAMLQHFSSWLERKLPME